jgi:hypothetical protein
MDRSAGAYTLRGHEWHFLIETMPEASQPVAGG